MELAQSYQGFEWLIRGWALCFGAVWGSFLNVAIYRWPRGLSVVSPRSQCAHCQTPIQARYNIPILGYLILRGRTACCQKPLSPRYPLIEALTAFFAVACAEIWFLHGKESCPLSASVFATLSIFMFISGLIVATFVDLEWMEIPDEVSLPGAALGFLSAPVRDIDPYSVLVGAGGAYLIVQVIFVWGYEHLRGRRGMGEGDSKLLLMIGAFVGWKGALFATVVGSLQGVIIAAILLLTKKPLAPQAVRNAERETERETGRETGHEAHVEEQDASIGTLKMPFGPFLALGALEFLFFGDYLVAHYFALLDLIAPA